MHLINLEKFLSHQPAYRLKQAYQAVFVDLIDNWQQATTLPQSLRQQLEDVCPLGIPAEIFISARQDNVKALLALADGQSVEAVLMRHPDRNTVCVSTQVGCALGCRFCATGRLGWHRDLTADEMIAQVLLFTRYLKPYGQRITNVVFMGMGEPFLNYQQFIQAAKFLNHELTFNIAARKISVSTAGIIEGIQRLASEPMQINLAVSLHAPDEHLRSSLMPINRRYPLKQLLAAVNSYIRLTKRKVMFEYLLIKDVNDSLKHARQLAKLMSQPLYLVNLIPYNPNGANLFQPSPPASIKKFKKILEQAGVKVTQRYTHGQDIQAACGQLAGAGSSIKK